MRYLVLDLECTCQSKEDPNKSPHEIIEIGAVLLDENYNYVDEFDRFVRPKNNSILTDYCKDLTSIKQEEVSSALSFPIVMLFLEEWLKDFSDITLVSWGDFDKKQLQQDCESWWIKYPFINHINAKDLFSKKLNRKPCGLGKACRIVNIEFEGIHHRGICDAKMVTKIFKILNTEEYKNFVNNLRRV